MSRSTMFGVGDPDARCSICNARTGGPTLCSQACHDEEARFAAAARKLREDMAALSSAPPTDSGAPTHAPDPSGTFRAVVMGPDLEGMTWDGDS